MATGASAEVQDVGVYSPFMMAVDVLQAGDVDFVVSGIKDFHQTKIGDTITRRADRLQSGCTASRT